MKETLNMSIAVSKMEPAGSDYVTYAVHDKMRHAIAQKIVDMAVKTVEHDYHRDYTCKVIVADADEYWRDVRDAAEHIARGYGGPKFTETGMI